MGGRFVGVSTTVGFRALKLVGCTIAGLGFVEFELKKEEKKRLLLLEYFRKRVGVHPKCILFWGVENWTLLFSKDITLLLCSLYICMYP